MFEADGRFYFIHVLSATAATSKKGPFQFGRIHLNVDTIINQGIYKNGCERGMPAGVAIKG